MRVDTVEAALLNAGHTSITVEGYAVEYAIAADNLALGLSVVADCVNPVSETRETWAEVARQTGAKLVNVEVICSNAAEHRRRVEVRHADAAASAGKWSPPDWEGVRNYIRKYQPWQTQVLRLDTSQETVTGLTDGLLDRLKFS